MDVLDLPTHIFFIFHFYIRATDTLNFHTRGCGLAHSCYRPLCMLCRYVWIFEGWRNMSEYGTMGATVLYRWLKRVRSTVSIYFFLSLKQQFVVCFAIDRKNSITQIAPTS